MASSIDLLNDWKQKLPLCECLVNTNSNQPAFKFVREHFPLQVTAVLTANLID